MVGALVSFDQLTKFLVVGSLSLGESIPVIQQFLHISLVHNPGAAFGLFATLKPEWREPFLFVIPFATLGIILVVFHRLKETQQMSIFALSMIVGGATGNLIDRLRLGFVIDFVDFHWKLKYHFPAFNLADAAITIGVMILLLSILYEKESET